jgi:hypothetical protein
MDIQSNRRARLAQLIIDRYNGSQAGFVDATGANQGEVSALLRNKSFGEKKARKIEIDSGIPAGWLDIPIDGEGEKPLVRLVSVPSSTDIERAFALDLAYVLNSYVKADVEGRRSILRFVKSREASSASSQGVDATSTD